MEKKDNTPITLVLFDIDGTLLRGKGVAKQTYKEIYKEIHNIDVDIDNWQHDGKPDVKIHYDILKEHNRPVDYDSAALMSKHMDRAFSTKNLADTKLLPGVKDLLDALQLKKNIHLGIVTGASEGVATTKLKHVDIEQYFELKSFGHLSYVRADIITHCISQFEEKYGPINKNNIFIIGDTVHDIQAAKDAGVKIIAVANGCSALKDLEEKHPDFICNDLSDTKKIIELINNGAR